MGRQGLRRRASVAFGASHGVARLSACASTQFSHFDTSLPGGLTGSELP